MCSGLATSLAAFLASVTEAPLDAVLHSRLSQLRLTAKFDPSRAVADVRRWTPRIQELERAQRAQEGVDPLNSFGPQEVEDAPAQDGPEAYYLGGTLLDWEVR
jgi:hypothetical protein